MLPSRSPLRLALVLVLGGLSLASCSSGGTGEGGGGGEASCAAVIEYAGHTYWGRGGLTRDPATTGRVVPAVMPVCDDSGGQDPPTAPEQPVRVAELDGVPLSTAFLWSGTIYARHGRELPASTDVWFRKQRCTSDGEFDLTADWLGVTGPRKVRFDGDLRPPYRLEVHVTDGPVTYVGTTIRLHADAATQPALRPRDVKESLWQGGQVAARVRCEGGRFRALSLVVPPSS